MDNLKENLHDARKVYNKAQLSLADALDNPFAQFDRWFKDAVALNSFEANAMVVSTVSNAGMPSSRVVLLKEYGEEGFIFFTNFSSAKGTDLSQNPNISILFFYEEMQRQIRINGIVAKLSEARSDAYFYNRPIDSQFGAIVSPQSARIESKETLEKDFEVLKKSNKKPQRPKHWGGYIVKPSNFEFWQGRPSRLHDRVCYEKQQNAWSKFIIAP